MSRRNIIFLILTLIIIVIIVFVSFKVKSDASTRAHTPNQQIEQTVDNSQSKLNPNSI
ncbi:hypothetical protein OAO18_00045 [Francisellaceae bacterium]|nr:hypothetical protein [Francisellaceae bacterium]